MLIYVSIALTVFMGFAALVIDGGRLFTLDTEMQSAADALALAGAAELDGNSDAITRANGAIANLVANNPTFSSDTSKIIAATPVYLKSLPSDDTPMATVISSSATTDPAAARFVAVQLTGNDDRSMDTLFAPAIGGGNTADAGAVAIAGFTQAVCKFTPLFICNPYPDAATLMNKLDNWDNDPDRRKLINLKKWAGSGQLSPGNFGFLAPQTGNGASDLKESLGLVDPGTCFSQTGVDLKTGNIASVRDAINTRFDMYDRSYNNKKGNAGFRPGLNVVKGYTLASGNNGCNASLDTTKAMALPLDTGFSQPAGWTSPRWGNGQWDCGAYWDMNHGNRNGNTTDDSGKPAGCADPASTTISRYDMYRWEIDNTQIPNNASATVLSPGENGNPKATPACYTGGSSTLSDSPDRRILYAAILECPTPNGSADDLPVLSFVKMFITRPMSAQSNTCGNNDENCETDAGDLFVEITGKVTPGADDAVLHDIVQLYR
ncbi:MAG TPA: pilus assembly protein TadG-related protein [Dongiaceae bacterium]